MVELYTKRNFRCDCGNKKFNTPCQLTPDKDDINEDNIYNQNFVGLYCVCSRPYPDPDVPEEEEEDMIQCIICEDWLHASHLEANVPSNDQYAEMICQKCMDKNDFIHDYTNYAVNVLDSSMVDVTTVENITTVNGKDPNSCNEEKINTSNTDNESVDHKMDTDQTDFKDIEESNFNGNERGNMDVANETQCKDSDENMASSDSAEKVEISEKKINDDDKIVETEEAKMETDVKDEELTVNDIERENIDNQLNGIGENSAESIGNGSETTEQSNKLDSNGGDNNIESSDNNIVNSSNEVHDNDEGTKTSVINENSAIENIANEQSSIPSVDDKDKNASVEMSNNDINKSGDNLAESFINGSAENLEQSQNHVISSEKISQSKNQDDKNADKNMESFDKKAEVNDENVDKTNNEKHDNDGSVRTSTINENSANDQSSILTIVNKDVSSEVIEEKLDNNDKTAEVSGDKIDTSNENINLNMDADADNDVEKSDKNDIENKTDGANMLTDSEGQLKTIETATNTINSLPAEIEMAEHNQQNNLSDKIDNVTSKENKRKFSEDDSVDNAKKAKIDFENCQRLHRGKVRSPGATFWPSNFRQKLCTCSKCIEMYKDLSVLFLTDLEDTVTAYEAMGKEKSNGVSVSQYEKGLQALSSLDRVQQINALTEYNNMRDKLVEFLKDFKDRKEVVKEEDIKEFFAGMKAKREPDGVYFCR